MNSPNEVEEAELEDNCTKSYAKVVWGRRGEGQFAVRLSCAVAHFKGTQEKFTSCTLGTHIRAQTRVYE